MTHFTIPELCKSTTAAQKGINNTPDEVIKQHLIETVDNLLDPIRDYYGKAIKVSSGYRCKKLNTAIGGASNSSHMYGYAADIKPADGNMGALKNKILSWAKSHKFDQIILEQCNSDGIPQWIHVGWKRGANEAQRKQYLKAKKVNGKWTYSSFQNK